MLTPLHAAMDFRADAGRLAMNAPNGDLTLWDTTGPGPARRSGRLRHRSRIVAAAWNPFAADSLVTAAHDGTVMTWQLSDNRPPEPGCRWVAGDAGPRHVGWVAPGRWVFSVTADGHASAWDMDDGTILGRGNITGGRPVVDAHRYGRSIVVVVSSGWARLWDPRREPDEWIRLTGEPVAACTWSDTLLVVAGRGGHAVYFDTDMRRLGTLPIPAEHLRALAVSDDGRLVTALAGGWLAATDPDGTVRWRIATGNPDITSVAIAGDVIAVGCGTARPALLSLATGEIR
jgi:hypothetical protein